MAVRHLLLAGAAVVVLAMGIYLALAVGREEAPATGPSAPVATRDTPAPRTEPDDVEAPPDKPTTSARTAKIPVKAVDAAPAETRAEKQVHQATGVARVPALNAVDPELTEMMSAANKAYDRGHMDDARDIALKVLATEPANVRMLRIVVSSYCVDGEAAEAQTYYNKLPSADQAQMRTRCERYDVAFK